MGNLLENIMSHLEFLGYSVEKLETRNEFTHEIMHGLRCKHPDHYPLIVIEKILGFAFIESLVTTKEDPSLEMLSFINTANSFLMLKVIGLPDDNKKVMIKFEMPYIGDYNKSIFGQFIENYNKECNEFFKLGTNGGVFK